MRSFTSKVSLAGSLLERQCSMVTKCLDPKRMGWFSRLTVVEIQHLTAMDRLRKFGLVLETTR